MTKKAFILFIGVIAMLTTYTQSNKILQYVPNYNFANNPLFTGIDLSESTGAWEVFANIRAIGVNDTQLSFDIVGAATISFNREAAFVTSDNILIWNGISNSSAYPNAKVILSVEGGVIRGLIDRGSNYAPIGISFIGNSHYVLFEDVQLSDTYPPMSNLANLEIQKGNSSGRVGSTCDGMVIYRLIIAYTPEFANTFPSTNRQTEINNFIVDVVNNVNATYVRSGVNVRARLAFSYQTPASQAFSFTYNFQSFMFPSIPINGEFQKYDEIFDYRDEFHADACMLLISNDHDAQGVTAGRASEDKDMGIYQRNGAAGTNYGVAHEIGHMFGLEHNREEYKWYARKINGFSWALDNKKSYGFRGNSYRTVMSYQNNSQQRMDFYADEGDAFPDGQAAGDSYAKARQFLHDHLSWVVKSDDVDNYTINNRQIASTQMASIFAYHNVTTTNFTVNNSARVNLKSEGQITLKPGTSILAGSEFNARVTSCIQTSGFRVVSQGTPTSNPKSGMDLGMTDPLESLDNDMAFRVYPNPAVSGDDLQLEYPAASDEKATVGVYNIAGVKLYSAQLQQGNHHVIHNLRLTAGLYLVRIQTTKGKIATQNLVIK